MKFPWTVCDDGSVLINGHHFERDEITQGRKERGWTSHVDEFPVLVEDIHWLQEQCEPDPVCDFIEARNNHWSFRREAEDNDWPFGTPDPKAASYYALTELGEVVDCHLRSERPDDARRRGEVDTGIHGELADLWLMLDTMTQGDQIESYMLGEVFNAHENGLEQIDRVISTTTSAIRPTHSKSINTLLILQAMAAIQRYDGMSLVTEVNRTIEKWRERCQPAKPDALLVVDPVTMEPVKVVERTTLTDVYLMSISDVPNALYFSMPKKDAEEILNNGK